MPLDGTSKNELIPRSTVEEIVGFRNKALELYAEAFTAIEQADKAIKAAHAMATRAAGGVDHPYIGSEVREVQAFHKAVRLPDRGLYERVARRLTDMRMWSWVVQRTDLERLMDTEAKEKLRQQMRYIPDRTDREGQLITGEEVEAGLPPVTVDNIYATIQQFALDADSIFRRGIANAFSKLDRRFRSHDGFKIGSRVILTYAFSSFSGGLEYGRMRDTLLDIERTFAVLDNDGHTGADYGGGVWQLDQDRRSRPGGQLITGEEVEAGLPPVTVDNIYATIQQFALDADSIFRRGIANAFSKLDRRFRSHDGFKIGSRVILTYAFSSFSGGLEYGRMRDTLLDIERTFAVLDNDGHIGADYGGGVWQLDQDRRSRPGYGPTQSTTHTKYFKIQGYMNGNAHLWFTRDDLVRKVNKLLAEWYGEVIADAHAQEDLFRNRKTTPARRFGFFPTPDATAEHLISKVALYRDPDKPPLTILEPSAGTGNLARRCATAGVEGNKFRSEQGYRFNHRVDCVEIQPKLARALRAEGLYRKVWSGDFLQMQPDPKRLYDRVVMNPPFDLERDIDHVSHALKFLKPEGQLIAIMSAGTEFRETKKAQALRALVKAKNGRFDDLPACSFSSVGTNVNTILLQLWNHGRGVHW